MPKKLNIPLHLKAMWLLIVVGAGFLTYHYTRIPTPQFNETNIIGQQNPLENQTSDNTDQAPIPPQDLITTADQAFNNHNYQLAINNYTKALQANPNSLETQIKLGRSYLNDRQIEKAREIFFQLPEENNEVATYQGIIYLFYQEFENAEAVFEKSQNQNLLSAFETFSYYKESDQTFLLALLAKSLIQNQEYQASIPLLFEILDQKPNYRDAWILLGYSQLKIDQPQAAIDALKNAQDLDPDKPETLFYLGLAYLKNNQEEQALYFINQAKDKGYKQ